MDRLLAIRKYIIISYLTRSIKISAMRDRTGRHNMRQNIKCFFITVFSIVIYSINVHASDPMLKWDASIGDVSGYKIYYGLSQGNYSFSEDVGNVTQYFLSNFSLSEGTTYYFVARAYNASGESGNSNVTTFSVPDSVDTTPPFSPQGVAGKIANNDIVLTWKTNSESDLAVYRVYYGASSRNYGLPIPVNGTEYLISGLNTGVTYYLAVTAVDTSGNESGYSSPEIQKTVMPETIIPETDTQAPSVSIGYPTSGSSYDTTTSSVGIRGTASDDKGVTEVAWSNSRGGSGTASGTNTWNATDINLGEGENLITVTATDAEGNASTDVLTVTYTELDTTAPVVIIKSPTSGTTHEVETFSVNISGIASDVEGVTQVTWSTSKGDSGTASGTSSWSATSIILDEGKNLVTVTATDKAGNTSTDTLTITYIKSDTTAPVVTDRQPPILKLKQPTTGRFYFTRKAAIKLSGTASDNAGVKEIRWKSSQGGNGVTRGNSGWEADNVHLSRWWNNITITAEDTAGNKTSYGIKVFSWRWR